jgi:hypothetical protein
VVEIDENGDWEKFEEALKMVAQRPKLARVTNGELYAHWVTQHPEYAAAHASTHSPA